MGFWSAYRASLKGPEVEEHIDLVVHRPLGYVIARAAMRTPITPNQLTLIAIALGIAAGVTVVVPFSWHTQIAGVCLILSAAFDCADGMLARMRKCSSDLGRMLDGVADAVCIAAAVGGNLWLLLTRYRSSTWPCVLLVAATVATVYTSQLHTIAYDHYKNVYLRMTTPGSREGEDLDAALTRQEEARKKPMSLAQRLAFPVYLGYLRGQVDFIRRFDPATYARLADLPPYDAERAAIYRRHALPAMRLARGWFGFGSVIFGLAFFDLLGRPDIFVAVRLVVYNAIFWLWFAPLQRRASREAFREMGLAAPGAEAVATT